MSWKSKQGSDLLKQRDWLVQRNQSLLLKGGRVVDPGQNLDKEADLLIERGKIVEVGKIDPKEHKNAEVLDLRGKIVAPGLLDMHAKLGEPGREDRETLTTGICAAAAGGFTGVALAPDSDPFVDNAGIVRWIEDRSSGAPVSVHPTAAILRDSDGKRLTDIDDIFQSGVKYFSDTGRPAANAEIMRRALEYCKLHGLTVSSRTQDRSLAQGGVMREGAMSTKLGMAPWPSIAESIGVVRNLLLALHSGGRLHLEAVSSAESVELIRWAREQGVHVTCDTTPHHLALSDEDCASFDGAFKMQPPLGTDEDRNSLRRAIADGTIDAIASDHTPLTDEETLVEFALNPDGVVGLETALGVMVRVQDTTGKVDWPRLIELMSVHPREILQLPPVLIKEGQPAEISLIDPEATWQVNPERFFSKGRNTPFRDWVLPAKALGVLNHGWLVLAPDARMLVK